MRHALVLYNARTPTLARPEGRLIVIGKARIAAVAASENLDDLRNAGAEVIDCQGQTLLPGFNDAHCHFPAFAESLLTLNLDQNAVRSISDIQQSIRRLADKLPPGTWIRGRGYNEFYLAEKRHPTRRDIDEATSLHPVKLTHRSGHAHVINSLAMSLAGISGETPEPPGGMIERDLETGEPNGLLYGMGEYLAKIVPPPTDEELEKAVRAASESLLSLGITSLQDASPHNDFSAYQMFRRWKSKGILAPRVTMMLGIDTFEQYKEQPLTAGDGELRPGPVKVMLDETRGQLNPSQAELNRVVFEVHRSGGQVALHAVEETTVNAACSALEYAVQKLPRTNHRHRVEHCSVCAAAMARRLASVGATVVTQPAFIYYSGDRYAKTVPPEQLAHLYPIATLLRSGLRVAASSDCPVAPPDPLTGIYAAACRKTETGQEFLPQERISPLLAIHMYTENAAYACFEEGLKGSIEPGKFADLVLLNADPTEIASEEIKDVHVEMTIVNGKVAWQRDGQVSTPFLT